MLKDQSLKINDLVTEVEELNDQAAATVIGGMPGYPDVLGGVYRLTGGMSGYPNVLGDVSLLTGGMPGLPSLEQILFIESIFPGLVPWSQVIGGIPGSGIPGISSSIFDLSYSL